MLLLMFLGNLHSKKECMDWWVPLWQRCASEGEFHKHPSSPGVRICTCREQGGHRLQTHQLQERKPFHVIMSAITMSSSQRWYQGLRAKRLQRSSSAFGMVK